MTADVKRVPKPYSAVAVVFCIVAVATFGLLDLHHSWSARGVMMGIGAVIWAFAYTGFRRTYLRAMRRPVTRRGFNGWLILQPGWLIALIYLTFWLVQMAITAVVWAILHLRQEGVPALLGMGQVLLLVTWAQTAAMLEQQRQAWLAGRLRLARPGDPPRGTGTEPR